MTKEEIVSQIKGQKCWRPWRGAGFAVYFELGEKLPNTPNETELRKGTYSIGLVACPWYVFQNNKLLFGVDSTTDQMDQGLKLFENQVLEDVQFQENGSKTSFIFSDGLMAVVHCSDPKDEWIILTPDQEVTINRNGLRNKKLNSNS